MCLLPPLMCVQAMLFLMVYKILGLSAKASPLQLNGLLLMMIFAAPLHAKLDDGNRLDAHAIPA